MLACRASLTHRAHAQPELATTGHPRPLQAKPAWLSGQQRTWADTASRHFPTATSLVGGRSGDSPATRPPNRGTDPASRKLSHSAHEHCLGCGRRLRPSEPGPMCATCIDALRGAQEEGMK
jgi:hypothetical protein